MIKVFCNAIRICIRFGLSSLMGMPSTIHGFYHFFCLVPYSLQECSWHGFDGFRQTHQFSKMGSRIHHFLGIPIVIGCIVTLKDTNLGNSNVSKKLEPCIN